MITKDIAELIKAIQSFAGINSYEVFSDFVELAAMSIVQVFTLKKDKTEEQLKAIRRKYSPAELKRFGEMLGMMIVAMDEYVKQGRYVDIIMEYTDIRVRRVPWADKYGSFDNIPPKAFISNGWWMFCCKCSGHVDADSLGGYTEDGKPYCKYCKERERDRGEQI